MQALYSRLSSVTMPHRIFGPPSWVRSPNKTELYFEHRL